MRSDANEISDNCNIAVINVPQPDGWNEPSAGGAPANDRSIGVEDSSGSAVQQGVTLYCNRSSDNLAMEKLEKRLSLTSSTDSGVAFCRICFQGPEKGKLLSPCCCNGSVQHMHQACLIMWISQRGSWRCELCNYKYNIIPISTKNPFQWKSISLTSEEKEKIWFFPVAFLALILAMSWLIWSLSSPSTKWQRQSLIFRIFYVVCIVLSIICFSNIISGCPLFYRIYNRWLAVNRHWKVLNYKKIESSEDHEVSTSTRTLSLPTQRGSSTTCQEAPTSTSSVMEVTTATASITITMALTDVHLRSL